MRANLAAVTTLRTLEADDREAWLDEQATLAALVRLGRCAGGL